MCPSPCPGQVPGPEGRCRLIGEHLQQHLHQSEGAHAPQQTDDKLGGVSCRTQTMKHYRREDWVPSDKTKRPIMLITPVKIIPCQPIQVGCTHLGHQSRGKTTLVAVPRWHPLHHARDGVVGITGPAASRAHVQDLSQELGIKAQPAKVKREKEEKPGSSRSSPDSIQTQFLTS